MKKSFLSFILLISVFSFNGHANTKNLVCNLSDKVGAISIKALSDEQVTLVENKDYAVKASEGDLGIFICLMNKKTELSVVTEASLVQLSGNEKISLAMYKGSKELVAVECEVQ